MKHVILLLLILFGSTASASELQIYELKHRSAEQLIPILRPMLEPGAGLSGSGYTLLIRTQPREQQQVAAIIEQFDTPIRQLLISVRQGHQHAQSGDGIDIHDDLTQPRSRVYSTRRQQLDSQDQQLRVLEGNWAMIRSGVAIPQLIQRREYGAAGAGSVEQGVEYRDVDSGFEVRPYIRGEQVTLEIRPFLARPSASGGGQIDQQEIVTTVSGQLGEWIPLGGVLDAQSDKRHGTVYSTSRRDRQQRNVSVKVEEIR